MTNEATVYPLSPNPIFWSIQGEAHLRGFQMCFIRLAGCSVGCPGCDTDYSKNSTATAEEIADEANAATPEDAIDRWAWITGGEPADHDLRDLIAALRARRFSVAVATSGHKRVIPPVDWLSVSPHDPGRLVQPYGNEVKLVDGLNGLSLKALDLSRFQRFMYRYVQPMSRAGREDPESLKRCLDFLKVSPDWSLSRQDHLHWGVA